MEDTARNEARLSNLVIVVDNDIEELARKGLSLADL